MTVISLKITSQNFSFADIINIFGNGKPVLDIVSRLDFGFYVSIQRNISNVLTKKSVSVGY